MAISLHQITREIYAKGSQRILIKQLSNNDNSKNQIYLGSDFDVIKVIPSGDIYSDGFSAKGSIFKAPLNFFWIDETGNTEHAKHAKVILYPDYPETRLSGFLKSTNKKNHITPSHLMQPPTPDERLARNGKNRFLLLGISEKNIFAYCTGWEDLATSELNNLIDEHSLTTIASVFYEYPRDYTGASSQVKLLTKLKSIYLAGEIESCRLARDGTILPYKAQNGAGYTLEAQFGIKPNGRSDPDFMDWELKAHSGPVVTLMTPEPNTGTYLDCLETFLRTYGTNIQDERIDFASRHNIGQENPKTFLTLKLEGYDPELKKISNPEGGLFLRNQSGTVIAGWTFNKIIDHWKNKHANTCFITYTNRKMETNYYQFGPEITLGKGTGFDQFLNAIYNNVIYYDPGINMKFDGKSWKPKKRNQFRVHWKNISSLYTDIQHINLNNI